jgi:hypothetical protein
MSENEAQYGEVVEIQSVIDATAELAVPSPLKAALIEALGPIAARIKEYKDTAEVTVVDTEADANEAARVCELIAVDIKAVEGQNTLVKIINGLHGLHRRCTAARAMFVDPMKVSRKTLKDKIMAWQDREAEKAAAEQRRLQAIADEKARREREALEKRAAEAKKPETVEKYQEAAAAVVAPVVTVEAPRASGIKIAKVWKVVRMDAATFLKALATRPDLHGFVEIKTTNLERAKAANPAMEVPGITFDKVNR